MEESDVKSSVQGSDSKASPAVSAQPSVSRPESDDPNNADMEYEPINDEERAEADRIGQAAPSNPSGTRSDDMAVETPDEAMSITKSIESLGIDTQTISHVSSAVVSEVYSPPRVTSMAREFGLQPGIALDITVDDDTGKEEKPGN